MSVNENRKDMFQEYFEYNVPRSHREEVNSLAEQVNQGSLSRRGFLTRTSALGIGLTAGSTVLTGLITARPAAAAPVDASKIAAKYKNLTIGVPVMYFADENEILLYTQLEAAAKAAGLNWKFLVQDCAGDVGKAGQIFDSFIGQGVDAIVDIVVTPRLVAAQMAKCVEKRIPVFGIYSSLSGGALFPGMLADYGGATNVEATYLANYMFFDQRIRHPGKKKIKLGIVDTDLDVIISRRGALNGLLSLPTSTDFEVVDSKVLDLTNMVASATQLTQGILTKTPDVDCMWNNMPPASVPVASAVDQAEKGETCKTYGHVAGGPGIRVIKKGESSLVATSWLDLVWTSWGMVDLVLQHLSGRPVKPSVLWTTHVVPCLAIDQDEANWPNVQEIDAGDGKKILTWIFDQGSYRDRFVASWNAKYSA